MKNKIFAIIVAAIMIVGMVPVMALPTKAKGLITKIETAEDLLEFIANVNSNNTYEEKTVQLMNDIDMDGKDWKPAGNYIPEEITYPEYGTCYFNGTFDGQGYAIKNLKKTVLPTSKDEDLDLLALFGSVGKDGVIKNLVIDQMDVKGTNAVAGIVSINMGAIENCSVINSKISSDVIAYTDGTSSATKSQTATKIETSASGGVCAINLGKIKECHVKSLDMERGGASAAGICGHNYGYISLCDSTDINIKNMTTRYPDLVNYETIGSISGIAGTNQTLNHIDVKDNVMAIVENCTNYSDITISRSTGGVCGFNCDAIVRDCVNYGNISLPEGNMESGYWSGGVCGDMWQTINDWTTAIINCVNYGNVSGSYDIGGIIGRCDFMVGGFGVVTEDPEEDNNKMEITNCLNLGNIEASNRLGGIVGKCDAPINGCFNTGELKFSGYLELVWDSSTRTWKKQSYFFGGVAGVSNGGIDYSGNSGKMKFDKQVKDLPEVVAVGGIAGTVASSHVRTSYNIAPITSTIAEEDWETYIMFVGGETGAINDALLSDCYFALDAPTVARYANGRNELSDKGIVAANMRGLKAKENMPALFAEGTKFSAHEDFAADGKIYSTSPYITDAFMNEATIAVQIGTVPATNDINDSEVWMIMLILSAIIAMTLIVINRKSKKE